MRAGQNAKAVMCQRCRRKGSSDSRCLTRYHPFTNMATVMRALSLVLMLTLALGAPTLCKGGVLQHPCDESHSNSPSHHDDSPKDGGCGHEDGCAGDPCSLVIRPTTCSKSSTTADDTLVLLTFVALSEDSHYQVCPDLGDLIGRPCADFEPSPPAARPALPLLI